MANQVHQHPDGTLHVRTQAGAYADSPEYFARDYGAPFPCSMQASPSASTTKVSVTP